MTLKKRKAAKMVGESRSIGEAMVKAGYTSETARSHTERLTKDEEWLALLDKELPDDKLTQVHKEGLKATRTISAISGKEATGGTVDFVDVPDYATRVKYLDLGYKVKKKITNDLNVQNNTFNLQLSPELQERVKKALELLKQKEEKECSQSQVQKEN